MCDDGDRVGETSGGWRRTGRRDNHTRDGIANLMLFLF